MATLVLEEMANVKEKEVDQDDKGDIIGKMNETITSFHSHFSDIIGGAVDRAELTYMTFINEFNDLKKK